MWSAGSGSVSYVYANASYNSSVTLADNYGKPLFVTAFGGVNTCNNSNSYDLEIYINGSWIGQSVSNQSGGVATGSFSFWVPAGATYSVTSAPYECGSGSIHLTAATVG